MISEKIKIIKRRIKNKKIKKKQIFSGVVLLLSFFVFLFFGFFHLSKFETTDEHFWKYERIPQYWKEGILQKNWKKTYINDKPGVSVALVSGVGLLFEKNPQNHRIRDKKITQNGDFTTYDTAKTEKINFAFRIPILITGALFLFFFFWIIKKITDSYKIASLSTVFLATTPAIVGISQIINPDALLWIFSTSAIFSFFALLKKNERKFLILTGIFTGLSLLSKYTANILFMFFVFVIFSNLFIYFPNFKESNKVKKYISKQLQNVFWIFLISLSIFSFFMPAVFVKFKYLYRSTLGSPAFLPVFWLFFSFIIFAILDNIFLKSKIATVVSNFLHKNKRIIFSIIPLLVLSFFVITIINAWTGEKFLPLKDLRENAFVDKELIFPMLSNDLFLVKIIKEMSAEFVAITFSLNSIVIIFLILTWTKMMFKKEEKFELYNFCLTFFILIYFIGALLAGILVNVRYSIMLYPLIAFLSALGSLEIISFVGKKYQNKIFELFLLIILFLGSYSLFKIKPFYLNYTNVFLPKNINVMDSWGYGSYEASVYLNSLPDSKKIIIWTDRSGVCQFFKGKCISEYRIDLFKTKPDYFVFSRRGTIRHRFKWREPYLAPKKNSFYYKAKPVWQLNIDDKEDNFVKIIKTDL